MLPSLLFGKSERPHRELAVGKGMLFSLSRLRELIMVEENLIQSQNLVSEVIIQFGKKGIMKLLNPAMNKDLVNL